MDRQPGSTRPFRTDCLAWCCARWRSVVVQRSRLGGLLAKSRVDPYVLAMVATVVVASVLPARGGVAAELKPATNLAIGFLFLLYGTSVTATD